MTRLTVYTLFDPRGEVPWIAGTLVGHSGDPTIHDLYMPGTGRSVYDIEQSQQEIRRLILEAQERGDTIVVSDFRAHLSAYDLPLCRRRYGAYDVQLGRPDITDIRRARKAVAAVVGRMAECKPQTWQRLIADAAVVYEDWQRRGVLHGGVLRHPQWLQDTATGRSSCRGFNLQGLHRKRPEEIANPRGTRKDVLLMFDWISADIRVAGVFSGDELLEQAFRTSDPYTVLRDGLNLADEDTDVVKLALLQGINSMNTDSPVFEIYPRLGSWIESCRRHLSSHDGYLDTILGRRFRICDRENMLQVLNGCMQGSVAHAMQLAIRRVWEKIPGQVLAEIHDSLVLNCPADAGAIKETMDLVAPIMLHPFSEVFEAGEIDVNPDFPFRVSMGRLWHGWSRFRVYRMESVAEIVDNKEQVFSVKSTSEEGGEESQAPPEAEGEGQDPRAEINRIFPVAGGVRPGGVPAPSGDTASI